MKWERALLGAVGLLAILIVGVVLVVMAMRDDAVPAAERPNASPIDSNSSRPPDDPALAPAVSGRPARAGRAGRRRGDGNEHGRDGDDGGDLTDGHVAPPRLGTMSP